MRDLVTQHEAGLSETGMSPDLIEGTLRHRRSLFIGLAGRLIALIAAFVMLAEITIYIPAITNFRYNWLRNHLAAGYSAALILDQAPQGMISDTLSRDVLASVGARAIALDKAGVRRVLISENKSDHTDGTYDLRDPSWFDMLHAAYATLMSPAGRVLTFIGAPSTGASGDAVEMTIDEAPLKQAMEGFSRRVLIYSLVVSAIVGSLAALALHRMILRPVRRLTTSIVEFGADPSDRSRIIVPSRASHEIGLAERALAVMQEALALEISHKKNLANLGLAVAKINHDMRNMLTSAQILSDRLANITDPLAQRLAPKLVATLDRAIRFCQATLIYGRAADEPPQPRALALHAIVAEAAETVVPLAHSTVVIRNEVPRDFQLTADAEQMFRILLNLMRNGVEALERAGPSPGREAEVRVQAWKDAALTMIEVADTGPGVPLSVRPTIFSAFQNSTRPGGSGLGLAIVADLIRGHGGTIQLLNDDDEGGATFRIALPLLPTKLR